MNDIEGEFYRWALGIDGTAGDAQDVPHLYIADEDGVCVVCGLAEGYRKHSAVFRTDTPPDPVVGDRGAPLGSVWGAVIPDNSA